ncbi:MAG TPA: hypothetical protein VI911_12005 [Patescibacteria group bacterium]|nr:hypothetical protein [Patescibacteria group bacterium]
MGKVLVGPSAVIKVDNVTVGLFDSCNWAVNHGAEAIHILGRFSPAEIALTSYEAITVNCSGFRIVGNGGHILPKVPKLQDLLNLEGVTISIVDRQHPEKPIMTVIGCVPVNYATGVNAKATSRIQVTYLGLKHFDESSDSQDESAGASNLP